MTTPPPRPDEGEEPVDASVVSPAVTAREAGTGEARAPGGGPVWSPRPVRQPPIRAWLLALAVDAMQWLLLPLLAPGFASPADIALDLVVAVALVRWCGWHWAFLPTFIAEIVPGLDLVPTWTAAVWLVAWSRGRDPRER